MTNQEDGNPLVVLFLVVMVDMIGFGIIIPFLTFSSMIWHQRKASSKLVFG